MTERELHSVRDLYKQIRDTENHLATLRARVQNLSPELDGMPHAAPIQFRVERLALEILENGRELEALHEQIWFAAAHLAAEFRRHVPDKQERTVLILRYISCMRFRDIGFRLHISDATTFRLHRDGLQKLTVR